ncbi:hypothetical protein MettiDRAFT_0812 [Methanolobus tindarius DSM 2278]|uniref:Uncharacterized protein n=1 Tax=Methanolobus tindarius DSM 2278 TaxID=1090322 RepID=W9DPX3_METTI|nr:hypothetical protein [Methanolobus tindarius]ETA67388.1 hypothetical protein MettiDRAFT_0812 [Methanolobus tindarius DSM 2278]
MGRKDKKENAKALIIRPGLDGIDLQTINIDDEVGKDPKVNKEYALPESTITLTINGKKTQNVYLIDGAKGTSVKLIRSDEKEEVGEGENKQEVSLLTMKTSPRKIAAILDTTMMQRAYTLKPDRRTLGLAFFIGIGVGFFTGLFF